MTRLSVVLALCSAAAWADIVPGDVALCSNKKVGDACSGEKGPGVCTQTSCNRPDYSKGVPPGRKVVPCVKCLPPKEPSAQLVDAGAPTPLSKDSTAAKLARDGGVGRAK